MPRPDPASSIALPVPVPTDLEVKDAQLIFSQVWDDLLGRHGKASLRFPREFIWLGGAPGAGKGTNTPFIAKIRDITAPPVVISDLLTSPEAVAIKNAGKMVKDRDVITLLFEELLKPVYEHGVIVDGFPRTKVQAACLKLFYERMVELHAGFRGTDHAPFFHKPDFKIAMLFVSEEVSVQRQVKRGREIREHNRLVRETGVGRMLEERVTDQDPNKCRERYRTYRDTTYEALLSLRQDFHYYQIDAEGDLPEVQENIVREFSYQSSLELSRGVYDLIHDIPEARTLGAHARQELVERLEGYVEGPLRPLFERVVKLIEKKIVPIVRPHAMTGHARINMEEPLLDQNPQDALRMMIDVLSERGFHATVDVHRMDVPKRVDLATGEIACETKKVYRIEVRYPPSDIRRGH